MRDQVTLACNDCKRRNYITTKNKRLHPGSGRVPEVLPVLPQAHGAQGNAVRRGDAVRR